MRQVIKRIYAQDVFLVPHFENELLSYQLLSGNLRTLVHYTEQAP